MQGKLRFIKRVCPICAHTEGEILASGPDYEYATHEEPVEVMLCAHCDVAYLRTIPSRDTLPLAYPPEYKPYHMTKSTMLNPIFAIREFLDRRKAADFASLVPTNMTALDVGCGDGRYMRILSTQFPNATIEGIDFSPLACARCRDQGLSVIQGDYGTITTEKNYDLINLNQVLEHIEEPHVFLDKIFSDLKEGGIVNIETPSLEGVDAKIFQKSYWGGYHFPRHLTFFTSKTLTNFLKLHHFEIVSVSYLLSPVFWVFSWHHWWHAKSVWGAQFFSDKNPFALAVATSIDIFQKIFFKKTSNMRVVARKPQKTPPHLTVASQTRSFPPT